MSRGAYVQPRSSTPPTLGGEGYRQYRGAVSAGQPYPARLSRHPQGDRALPEGGDTAYPCCNLVTENDGLRIFRSMVAITTTMEASQRIKRKGPEPDPWANHVALGTAPARLVDLIDIATVRVARNGVASLQLWFRGASPVQVSCSRPSSCARRTICRRD